jgi:hypothetical protein
VAIATTATVRAQCDACPQVVYADNPAEPKGYQVEAREVDGNGAVVTATAFACQSGHVGAAVRNVLKAAREASKARPAIPAAPEPVKPAEQAKPANPPVSITRNAG